MCKGKGVHEENSRFRFVKPQSERIIMKKKELKKRIEKLEQQINKFAKDMEFVHSDSEIYNQLLTKACNDCAMLELKTNKRLKALEQKVKEPIEQQKETHSSSIEELKKELANFEERRRATTSQIHTLRDVVIPKIEVLEEKTENLGNADFHHSVNLKALKNFAEEKFKVLKQQKETHSSSIQELTKRLKALEQKVSNLESKNQILSGRRQKEQ